MTDGKIVELGNSPSLASGKQSLSGKSRQKICGPLERVVGLPESNWGAFKFWRSQQSRLRKRGDGAEGKVYGEGLWPKM